MVIWWGGGSKTKNIDDLWVPYYCGSCAGLQSFLVLENYRYGHVYGIRIAKYKAQYFLVCTGCDRAIGLESREKYQVAQEIARRVTSSTSSSFDALDEVINVARFVTGNTDLVQALENARQGVGAEDVEQPDAVEGATKTCPDCAESIKAAARKCRYCGYEFG